jgi:hypothetical protein
MVVTHGSSAQEKWWAKKLYKLKKKLNTATKKDPYPLPFIDGMLIIIVGYETYYFLDGYSGYH